MKLVIFDIAGTTIADRGEVAEAFKRTLATHHLPADDNYIQSRRGQSKLVILSDLVRMRDGAVDEAEVQRACETFYQSLRELWREHGVEPIPGAAETFAWLHERDFQVALTTGFDRGITELLLKSVGWDDGRLDAVVTGDDVAAGRPAPDLIHEAMRRCGVEESTQVMVVGDTPADLQAGHNAGVGAVIGVLSGAHGAESLGQHRPTRLIGSVAELPGIVDGDLRPDGSD